MSTRIVIDVGRCPATCAEARPALYAVGCEGYLMNAASPAPLDGLAQALMISSRTPVLLLDSTLTVVASSTSFSRTFGLDSVGIRGQQISNLGTGEWSARQLISLLKSTLSGAARIDSYEMDLVREGHASRSLELNACKLDYDSDDVRLLLTITDVTDVRDSNKVKDDLLREKTILLQELQHRVANSLQIIASVLIQNARSVDSDETRVHLFEAHNRVMSVAAIQRQLAPSRIGAIDLLPYLIELCSSISASMIRDTEQLSLEVTGDDSAVSADVSVSIGLIVTELVINALKHAFPNHRNGRIIVDYRSDGEQWTLSVRDDGIGVRTGVFGAKPGLGTGIVDAISQQLGGTVKVTDAHPGTQVLISHAPG